MVFVTGQRSVETQISWLILHGLFYGNPGFALLRMLTPLGSFVSIFQDVNRLSAYLQLFCHLMRIVYIKSSQCGIACFFLIAGFVPPIMLIHLSNAMSSLLKPKFFLQNDSINLRICFNIVQSLMQSTNKCISQGYHALRSSGQSTS